MPASFFAAVSRLLAGPSRPRGAALVAVLALAQIAAAQPAKGRGDFASVDATVAALMKEWRVPGIALGVIRDGQVVYLKGYGYRDVERRLPVTPATRMAIGSNSKSFTALLMGMLADQGKLDWDAPVKRYLPDFALYDGYAGDHLSPRDLVRHDSGLPRHDLVWYGRDLSRQEIYRRVRYVEPNVSFREKWQYNNLMFLTAGVLVEKLWGRTWEDLVTAEIFRPLGMTGTLPGATGMDQTSDFAWPYDWRRGAVTRVPIRNIDVVGPAGSIVSNVEDMTKYILFRMARGAATAGPRISAAAEKELQSPQFVADPDSWPGIDNTAYALGLVTGTYRGHLIVAHSGGIDGFISQMAWLPNDRAGVMVLSNLGSENPVPELVMAAVFDRVLGLTPPDYIAVQKAKDAEAKRRAEAAKAKQPAAVAGTQPSHPLAAFAGSYQHPGYGKVVIREANGGLEFVLDALVAPLKHFHYDTFELGESGSLVPLNGLVTFSSNVKGEVDQLAVPLEPAVKPILFRRVP